MYRGQTISPRVVLVVSRLRDAALGILYFVILMVWPNRRSHYGQQFLYKTEGQTFEQSYAAFGATADGQILLVQLPDSVAILRDRARLGTLPLGSLGRSYYDFMVAEEIDEGLYIEGAIAAGLRFESDAGRCWFRTRVEAAHDLRHLLTGYGIELFGETCLLAFRFGQTFHPGTFVLATFAFGMLAFRRQPGLVPAMREAYRHGRTARLLDLMPWEFALERPLVELQREFGIESPLRYDSSDCFAGASVPARQHNC